MNGSLATFGKYCAARAVVNRAGANQIECAIDLDVIDPTVVQDELAHIGRLRRDADLWDQLAGEITTYLAADESVPAPIDTNTEPLW